MDFFAEPQIAESSNWFYNAQSQQDKIMEISPFDGFFEFDWPIQNKQLDNNEFKDLENFTFDFNLPHLHESFDFEVDQKPLNVVLPNLGHCNEKGVSFAESVTKNCFVESSSKIGNEFVSFVKKEENQELSLPLPLGLPSCSSIRKKSVSLLEFDEIKKHFDVPITMAAKKLNVGITLLKKRCRELKITRWPHRKLKSLMLLIDHFKELGLVNEVAKLKKYKKMIEKIPGMELNEEIKKLRQAYFKATYKKRRLVALKP